MYLNHMMNKFKKAESGMLLRNSVNEISAAKIQEINTPKVDTDSINDRLGKGDKTALKELEAQKIAYTLAENASGYTVKYSYNGTNYTITYYAKEEITEAKPEKPVTNDAITETESDEAPAQPKTEEPSFDYSDIDKDAKAEDFYNEDNISSDKKLTMLFGSKGDVDSGAWDDLFAELEKMKPQLLDYMKQQLETAGRSFDQDKAEKIINRLITQAVERIPQDGVLWSYSGSGIGDSASNRLPENPTIEDLMDYMKNCLDLTPDKEDNGVFAQLINTVSKGYQFDFELKADDGNLKINSYNPYYEEDGYLLDTADYFLTDEEKEMKFVMQVTDSEYSSYGTSDKAKLFGYIDTYAKHMEKVIRHRYPQLTDAQITSIMTDAKNKVKYSDLPKPDENGVYSIDDTLAKLEELVLKYAKEYTT